MKLTEKQISEILNLNSSNVLSNDIANTLNLPLKAIQGCLKNNKRKSVTSRNMYNIQLRHDYFDNIDTPEKAYLVGLLASDGNINKHSVRLRIHPDDRELVDFMCKELNWLKKPTITKNNKSLSINVSIRSLRMVISLINNHNFSYNKTYVNLFKDLGDYTRYFILGLFDGDGSIFYSKFKRKSGNRSGEQVELYRFSYTGNVNTCNDLVKYLDRKGVRLKCYTLKKNANIAYVHSTKIQELINLYNYLYEGHNLGLKRKRCMFNEAVKFYSKERCSTTIISDSHKNENMV